MKKKSAARKIKILVCDPLDREGVSLFKKAGIFRLVQAERSTPVELKRSIRDASGLIVRSSTRITSDIINGARRLKIIGRAGVGTDNVDVAAASKKGIVVVNTPEGNTVSAAEHTISLMLALARNITPAHLSMRDGRWDRKKFIGVELFEKTLGLVGLGRIGGEVAKRAQALGMRVLAHDPYLGEEKARELGVRLEKLQTLLRESDFLSLHLPLTDETYHMIGQRTLARTKKGVRIINCARGGLIDEGALLKALDQSRVAGAALDVFEEEPPRQSGLVDHPRVLTTPHLGASTGEAQVKVSIDVSRTLIDFFTGKGIRNAVNAPALEPEMLKEMEPYIHLAEKIGLMHAQLAQAQIREVHITYHGDLVERPTALVSSAFLKGLLTPILAEHVNEVNAMLLAKERGIRVAEVKSTQASSFTNLIAIMVKTARGKRLIGGTLFTRTDPRIVLMDDLRIDCVPRGFILLIVHKDVPGIVGHIGTLLGRNRINIADMTVGRKRPGGDATTLISIDGPATPAVLEKIKRFKHISDARVVRL